ncbi:hypothetical protein [Rubripirellula lacrimiformis]|nr:hypothetical protein [Rubripirellula lacrimiformis]
MHSYIDLNEHINIHTDWNFDEHWYIYFDFNEHIDRNFYLEYPAGSS